MKLNSNYLNEQYLKILHY